MKTLKNLKYDVVCVGGGTAGVFAAVSAAQKGVGVLLLEKAGFLGGSASLGEPIEGIYRTPLSETFMSILEELNGIAPSLNGPAFCVNGETVKLAYHRLCRQNGVDLLLYSEAYDLRVNDDDTLHIKAVNKNALLEIDASIAVDATADGSLVRSAKTLLQDPPLKVCAAMTLTGLNPMLLCSRNEQGHPEKGFTKESPGSRYYGPLVPGGLNCAVTVCLEPHRFLVQFPLPDHVNPCDCVSRTHAVAQAHILALELFRSLTKQPGFETVRLSNIAPQLKLSNAPSVRRPKPVQSCASGDAIAALGRRQDDISYFVPEHLLVSHPGRLLVCGALAVQDTTPSAMRSFGAAIATGEAAGTCSALAIQKNCAPADITAKEIRQSLSLDL